MKTFKSLYSVIVVVITLSGSAMATETGSLNKFRPKVQFNQKAHNVSLSASFTAIVEKKVSEILHHQLKKLEKSIFNNVINTIKN